MESGSIHGGGEVGASARPMTFRLHRAYGGPGGGAGVGGGQPAPSLAGVNRSVASALSNTSSLKASSSAETAGRLSGGPLGLRSLVAGVVPGRVDFSGDVPALGSVSRAFYRHPADRNAAAVQIDIGKRIDISG